ncbi:hypothetical protein M514_10796 [Trichuris suis]|uniref:Uncharacterized protein n=1 Tax=Trichuris suis TaxID=68888 RepID=A0A085N4S2_9BILA|nr:hypothetical protein M513_10796 [Trichuris suis]KFD64468.1 hypothetical protein M514_10796 [Trichuris suis]
MARHQRHVVNHWASLSQAPPPDQHWQGHQLSGLTSSRRASVPPRQSGGRASVHSTDHSGDITTNTSLDK